jgi:hypothetical protein
MPTSAATPARRLASAVVYFVLSATLLAMTWNSFAQIRRIATNPHVTGRIERTWVKFGKRGGRFADVTFTASGAVGPVACRIANLRIGGSNRAAAPGDGVDLAPIPGAGCVRPDAPDTARSSPMVAVLAGLGVLALFMALKVLTDAWSPRLGSRFPLGPPGIAP